ncbi:MAG: DinB family protein [Acidobacteria bacterium]|nr:DinB family protein [Acidobacteriota bacterium]
MKRVVLYSLFLAVGMALAVSQLRAADIIAGPLKAQWEITRGLVVGMVEAVPESKWGYKPTPEVRSFREQFTHLISENFYYMSMVADDKAPDRAKLEALTNRDEIIKTLKDSYDYGAKALSALTDQKATEMITIRGQQVPRWTAALYNLTDNMDHYGNLVVYVRLNGMVPPRTAARAAQPAAQPAK